MLVCFWRRQKKRDLVLQTGKTIECLIGTQDEATKLKHLVPVAWALAETILDESHTYRKFIVGALVGSWMPF